MLSAISGLAVAMIALPWSIVPGLGLAIVGIVLGIRARRASVVARRSEGSGVVAVVLGSMGLALALVLTVFYAVFWDQLTGFQDCQAGANTLAAESSCREQLETEVRIRLGI